MRKVSFLMLVSLIALLFASCGNKKPKDFKREYVDPRMVYGMDRSEKDTTELIQLTTSYLESLKKQNYDEALSQLYDFNQKDSTIIPLTNELKAELIANFKAFPVVDYKIKEVLLYSDVDTEVRYDIVLFKKEKGDDTPNTIQGVVNPRRVKGRWCLTISNKSREDNYKED